MVTIQRLLELVFWHTFDLHSEGFSGLEAFDQSRWLVWHCFKGNTLHTGGCDALQLYILSLYISRYYQDVNMVHGIRIGVSGGTLKSEGERLVQILAPTIALVTQSLMHDLT